MKVTIGPGVAPTHKADSLHSVLAEGALVRVGRRSVPGMNLEAPRRGMPASGPQPSCIQ